MYRCRVCGLDLPEPPWGVDGRTPSYEYCPCCGVEFGYRDATPFAARNFRRAWLKAGAIWTDADERPCCWDLVSQLSDVPEEFR